LDMNCGTGLLGSKGRDGLGLSVIRTIDLTPECVVN
jgi:hypothetical protein